MTLQNHVPACFADIIVNIVRGKWTMHILLTVGEGGGLHFNAIRRSIPGISAKVLREQLDYLLAAGVLQRERTDTARREVVYSYTERGRDLRTLLDGMDDRARRWQEPVGGLPDKGAASARQPMVNRERAGSSDPAQQPTLPAHDERPVAAIGDDLH